MPPTNVALVGAAGTLGPIILDTLLSASHTVTILTRVGSSSTSKLPAHPNVTIKAVDLTSTASMVPALVGIEVVVSCVAAAAMSLQNPLIDAAVQAGVKRFIPAEYGLDSTNAKAVKLPIIQPKAATQKYLNEKVKQSGPAFSWTAVVNGLFLDWVLQCTTVLMDVKQKKATLYNGGDVKFSMALLSDIAKAVVGVIEKQEETRDRVVYVHSAVVTQNQLIGYVKEKDDGEWSTTVKRTEESWRELKVAAERGDFDTQYWLAPVVGSTDEEYGCDFTGHVDNELFGIEEMNEDALRALVHGLL